MLGQSRGRHCCHAQQNGPEHANRRPVRAGVASEAMGGKAAEQQRMRDGSRRRQSKAEQLTSERVGVRAEQSDAARATRTCGDCFLANEAGAGEEQGDDGRVEEL